MGKFVPPRRKTDQKKDGSVKPRAGCFVFQGEGEEKSISSRGKGWGRKSCIPRARIVKRENSKELVRNRRSIACMHGGWGAIKPKKKRKKNKQEKAPKKNSTRKSKAARPGSH